MGIVFIGIFTLIALINMKRLVKHHNDRAVSFVLCLTLVSIQAVQIKGLITGDSFHFGFSGYLFLSACFLLAIKLDDQRHKKVRLERIR